MELTEHEKHNPQPLRFPTYKHVQLFHGVPTRWHWIPWYPDNLVIGDRVDIGAHTDLFAQCGITIERDVQIGSHCAIYSKSTIDGTSRPVVIRAGACIGSHCVILPGVEIGMRAIVGACSLVKTNIPANEVWCGVPARFKRRGDWE